MKMNLAVGLAMVFLYLLGIGGAKAYYHSDNVDPNEVCAGMSKTPEYRHSYGQYYVRVSPFDDCVEENKSDPTGETMAAIIWPISLPVVLGERELGLW